MDLTSSRVLRAFGSEGAYSDALSSVHKFNSRLLRERKLRLRLPFVDSQTHIIQTPTQNYLWRHSIQRLMPVRKDQVLSYPRKSWYKKRPNPPSLTTAVQSQSSATMNGMNEPSNVFSEKNGTSNETTSTLNENDPRIVARAGDLGMSDADLQTINTLENPGVVGSRHPTGSSDDSSQSSTTPMTGLVQPQQPHWPQHPTSSQNHHHLHSGNYVLDGDDDPDDFDFDEYGSGSGPATPNAPASPGSSYVRSKRGSTTKKGSQSGGKKSAGGNSAMVGSGGSHTSSPTGNRRQQYTLAELPYVCEFCPARYKTKPGLQYHLAKHKESNSNQRTATTTPSTAESSGSLSTPSPTIAQSGMIQQKYMNPPMDPHVQQHHQQYPTYPGHQIPGGPQLHNSSAGHMLSHASTMPIPSYQMNHPQGSSYGMGPRPPSHNMSPSVSMPLTVAALSGSPSTGSVPYYATQQHQMMHQQQQQQQQQQQHLSFNPSTMQQLRQQPPTVDPNVGIVPGIQCDFCGGDEQENKTTKLSEQMITCKDCGGSAHPTCLKFTPNMVRQVKTYAWQCMECKTCTECGNSENDSELLFCDDCDRGYHMYCCSPPLSKAPDGDWRCKLCCAQFGELPS